MLGSQLPPQLVSARHRHGCVDLCRDESSSSTAHTVWWWWGGTRTVKSQAQAQSHKPRSHNVVGASSQQTTHREEVVVDGRDGEAIAHPYETGAGDCALLRQADSLRRFLHVSDVRNADSPLEGRRPEELGARRKRGRGRFVSKGQQGAARPRIRTMVFGPAGWFHSSTKRERAPVAAMRSGASGAAQCDQLGLGATSRRRLSAASAQPPQR
jgi:hypothetical protein